MALGNARQILRTTSGLTTFKLLALTAQYSRPPLAPLFRALLGPFTEKDAIPVSYRQGGRELRMLIRNADQESDLHSVLEVVARVVYPLDLAFDPDLIIDGGANIGLFSMQAAAVYPRAKVVMCEPLPRNIAQLETHMKLNGLDAELLPVCLGGTHGVIPFYCRHANGSSFDPEEPYQSVLEIEVLRLAEILEGRSVERILLKLDIEGMEVGVLQDFVPGEKRAVVILGELHHQVETRPAMERLFAEHGWSFRLGDLAGRDAIFEARSPAARALGLREMPLH